MKVEMATFLFSNVSEGHGHTKNNNIFHGKKKNCYQYLYYNVSIITIKLRYIYLAKTHSTRGVILYLL